MPYEWTPSDTGTDQTLTLWPHQSLPPRGFVLFIAVTAAMISLPLFALLGSVLLWALLPFLALAVGGIWFAIHRNRQSARILEVLTLRGNMARLERSDPAGNKSWECNRYWTRVTLHKNGGPVPNYVTLAGNGREVEIGAFLSEDERIALSSELPGRIRAEQ
ncbi:DUF2244 domain-containing protein [Seohaeicola zhoushanensis]|uniref:DUF2244 domain-containing protein n=1 Tax=Seohaeicola zhoushanensis TaxID=1569283 RepID=A0A8J3M544_9RHOB|nr:DUF2244 domain-containing protein [Seohaeicola zhoushanensis]GHF37422.1 hypothetical protein GCM10017056_06660 [Seohaeicola zhoushanensis]